jgi:hypothetical protein
MPKRGTGTDATGAPTEGYDDQTAAPTKAANKKPKTDHEDLVHPKRWKELKGGEVGDGPIIYWC